MKAIINSDPYLKKIQTSFKLVRPPIRKFNLYNTISKKRKDADLIVKKFNAALEEMKKDGSYDQIIKRFN